MTHRYLQPVQVTFAASELKSFQWRGVRYLVREVLATWHLCDRWWERYTDRGPAAQASDRLYYRVRCVDEEIFDLYHDRASALWVLDCAHD